MSLQSHGGFNTDDKHVIIPTKCSSTDATLNTYITSHKLSRLPPNMATKFSILSNHQGFIRAKTIHPPP